MRNETAANGTGVRGFFRDIRGGVVAAAVLLACDVAFSGSYLMSIIVCPIWFLVSLIRNAIQRPGWCLALVRIGLPALTLGLVWINTDVQLKIAEANARRIVAACEAYHAAHGRFPEKLDELVPNYMNSVPVAKYCLGPGSRFQYYSKQPLLWWEVFGFLRRIYDFNTRRWSYLD
ncbi:hypothetical protein [Aquisphaera insulae]|uniref:hypothetical protein n=1 Tax=Aquisphaera insulae TaxID=2712864 RepID=UPI0013EAAE2B|nr:hypothetical protein [Aquisphaera insulae]